MTNVRRQIRLDVIDDLLQRVNLQPHELPCALFVKDKAGFLTPTKPGAECNCWRGHTIDLLRAERQDTERQPADVDSK